MAGGTQMASPSPFASPWYQQHSSVRHLGGCSLFKRSVGKGLAVPCFCIFGLTCHCISFYVAAFQLLSNLFSSCIHKQLKVASNSCLLPKIELCKFPRRYQLWCFHVSKQENNLNSAEGLSEADNVHSMERLVAVPIHRSSSEQRAASVPIPSFPSFNNSSSRSVCHSFIYYHTEPE